ncbi:hypothetical protein AOLI_G00095580 [Acnodon oligacanthus]
MLALPISQTVLAKKTIPPLHHRGPCRQQMKRPLIGADGAWAVDQIRGQTTLSMPGHADSTSQTHWKPSHSFFSFLNQMALVLPHQELITQTWGRHRYASLRPNRVC